MFFSKRIGIAFLLAIGTFSASVARAADSPVVSPLMLKILADTRDREVLVMTVDYPPGGSDPVHRHDAHAFVYVLEGSIVMQVIGREPVALVAGQTFYEAPGDLHLVGRNASQTKSAKFLVVMIKERGVEPVLPPY